MANTLDNLLRRRGQATLLRIDHSDVYFENDRLDKDLSFDISTLQREKFRQLLVRKAEILQLKKTFSFQQRSFSSASLIKRMERKPSTQQIDPSPYETVEPMGRAVSAKSDSSMKSESVKPSLNMGPGSMKMSKSTHSFLDTSDTSSSRKSDALDSDESADDDTDRSTQVREPAPRSATLAPRSAPVTRKSRIDAMMRTLKLDKIPTHWYTTVVPAADVQVSHYLGKSQSRQGSSRPHTSLGVRSGRPFISRSSTRSDGDREARSSMNKDSRSAGNKEIWFAGTKQHRPAGDREPKSAGNKHSMSSGNRDPSPPPPPDVTTAFCLPSQCTLKTRRQLKEIANQETQSDMKTNVLLQAKIKENIEEKKKIEAKVRDFILSLDELQKSRIKGLIDHI
ncbi:hypothetical protein Btru_001740 [Bulinus truncatus]|nr:hypothetical protein Btru_001740 [Bulinus truncatus]